MISPYDTVVALVDGFEEFGSSPRHGYGRCPAHEDSSPSLHLTEAGDGRLLVNCFAGCSVAEIVSALGLEMRNLFPAANRNHAPIPARQRRPREGELLRILSEDATTIAIIADKLLAEWDTEGEMREVIAAAAGRIASVREQWERMGRSDG